MKRSTIINHVIKEIENIKKFATNEQKSKLNIYLFDPNSSDDCIYGQMTGNCFSDEAQDLILKCCSKTTDAEIPERDDDKELEISEYLERATVSIPLIKNITRAKRERHFSFLELYIAFDWTFNENIVDYIKGETKVLKLK